MTDEEALRAAVCIQRHKGHLTHFDYARTGWDFQCVYCGVSAQKAGREGQPSVIIWGLGDVQLIVPMRNGRDLAPLGNGNPPLTFDEGDT